jgi:hypothetical protein
VLYAHQFTSHNRLHFNILTAWIHEKWKYQNNIFEMEEEQKKPEKFNLQIIKTAKHEKRRDRKNTGNKWGKAIILPLLTSCDLTPLGMWVFLSALKINCAEHTINFQALCSDLSYRVVCLPLPEPCQRVQASNNFNFHIIHLTFLWHVVLFVIVVVVGAPRYPPSNKSCST